MVIFGKSNVLTIMCGLLQALERGRLGGLEEQELCDVACRRMDVAKLKEKGPAPAVLDALMRQACAELELVSVVQASAIGGGEGARQKPQGNAPRGETNSYIERLRRSYREASCNWDRLAAIQRAQDALQSVRANKAGRYRDGRRRHTVAWKEAVANDTRASALVGRDFGCSAGYVRQLRLQYRRG